MSSCREVFYLAKLVFDCRRFCVRFYFSLLEVAKIVLLFYIRFLLLTCSLKVTEVVVCLLRLGFTGCFEITKVFISLL
jgi:hypothetical protein